MSFVNYWQQDVPNEYRCALRRHAIAPTRFVLTVSVLAQTMVLWEKIPRWTRAQPFVSSGVSLRQKPPDVCYSHEVSFFLRRRYLISTSKFGVGQEENSNGTPLGLHRIARKIGGGLVMGTVFKGRRPIGNKWQGSPKARIVHRILWLDGLETGFNRGGSVDTVRRYIYIHGFGDVSTLGQPESHGCVHVAMNDLLPLFELVSEGTQVWMGYR
jgi:hypothetical protein